MRLWVRDVSRVHDLPTWEPQLGMTRNRFAKTSRAISWLLATVALGSSPNATFAASPAWAQLPSATPNGNDEAVVVYLVRHAERAENGTDDPPLALAGQIRVQQLLGLLADVDLTHVHTTDFKRTRDTARPFAERAGVEFMIYDPRELEALASEVAATPGRHLVAGHSNTTPQLVAALGGDPSDPIDEFEYDRLYIVVIQPDKPAMTTLLRFGEPYVEGQDFGLRAGSAALRNSPQEPR